MNRTGISRTVLIACVSLLLAELVQPALAHAVLARLADGDVDLVSKPYVVSAFVFGLVVVAPIVVFGRLGNYVRPSTLLLVGVAVLLVVMINGLLPISVWVLWRLLVVAAVGLALVTVASLLIVVQQTANWGRGVGLGLWTAMTPLAFANQIDVGALTQNWRLIGWVIAGLLLLILVAGIVGQPVEPASTFERFDVVGALAWAAGIAALWILLRNQSAGSASVVVAAVGVGAFAALTVWTQREGAAALIPPGLLTRRGFVGALTGVLVLGIIVSFTGMPAVAVRWSSLYPGAVPSNVPLVAVWVSAAAVAPVVGYLMDRRAGTVVGVCGAVEVVVGIAATAILVQSAGSIWGLLPGLVIFGLGLGTLAPWLIYVAFGDVPRAFVGAAAGLVVSAVYLGPAVGQYLRTIAAVDVLTGAGFDHVGAGLRASTVLVGSVLLALAAFVAAPGIARRRQARTPAREREPGPPSVTH